MSRAMPLIILSCILTACYARRDVLQPIAPVGASSGGDAYFEVENEYWTPVRVFVLSPSGRIFLGEVDAQRSARWVLPATVASRNGSVGLLLQPRGSADEYNLEGVAIRTEDRLVLQVRKNLRHSRLFRR